VKLPEPLFAIINPVMGFLLRSPLHGLLSDSLMLITFTGRKSGRQFTTPVRYVKDGDTVRCFTSAENQWWRNLRAGARVSLLIKRQSIECDAQATFDNPAAIKEQLVAYLDLFPQDATYHDIRLNKDKSLNEQDLEQAAHNAIVIEAVPT
jgi:deazaflavin-dependent oxidoreductase (nitroreductase family)